MGTCATGVVCVVARLSADLQDVGSREQHAGARDGHETVLCAAGALQDVPFIFKLFLPRQPRRPFNESQATRTRLLGEGGGVTGSVLRHTPYTTILQETREYTKENTLPRQQTS